MSTIRRHSLLAIVATTLLVLGILRMALFVGNEPVLGYGEQSGFHRVTGCIGIDPVLPAVTPGVLARPSGTYVTSRFSVAACYPSSAALIAAPVVILYGIASIASEEPEILIPLRAFGIFNLLLFAALGVAIALGLRGHTVAMAVHGGAVIFRDSRSGIHALVRHAVYGAGVAAGRLRNLGDDHRDPAAEGSVPFLLVAACRVRHHDGTRA